MKNVVALGHILRWDLCAERAKEGGTIGMDESTDLLGLLPWNKKLVTFVTVSSPGFVCLILLFHLGMGGCYH